jgi:hypothetical protein
VNSPVKNYYVVLDTNTLEWHLGNGYISSQAPFKGHTASLYNNYMFIAFGKCGTILKINKKMFTYLFLF